MWLTIRPEELDIETKQIDTLFWSSILSKSQAIRKVLPKRADKVIGGNLFNALYQWNPKLKSDPPDPALAAWLNSTMTQPNFEQLRTKTVGDRNLSAAATVRLYKELTRPKESMIKTVAQIKENLEYMQTVESLTNQQHAGVDIVKQAQEKLGEVIRADYKDKPVIADTQEISLLTGQPVSIRNGRPDYSGYSTNYVNPQDQAIDNTIDDLAIASNIAGFDSPSRGAGLDRRSPRPLPAPDRPPRPRWSMKAGRCTFRPGPGAPCCRKGTERLMRP